METADQSDHIKLDNWEKLLPLLSAGSAQSLLPKAGGISQIALLEAAIALLIKAGIDFDVNFNAGTTRDAPSAELVIFITPVVQLTFVFAFAPGNINPF